MCFPTLPMKVIERLESYEQMDSKRLSFWNGKFWFGKLTPTIKLTPSDVQIGCQHVTSEAMDELCARWTKFRSTTHEEIIQP